MKTYPPVKKKSALWMHVVLSLLPLVLFACIVIVGKMRTSPPPSSPATAAHGATNLYTASSAEKHILGKAIAKLVHPELIPVVMYEARDGRQYFGASGVVYFNIDTQKWHLLTMAHAFFKRDKPVSFFLRKVTPTDAQPTWCIKRIITIGSQWGKNIDIAECELQPLAMPMPLIECSYEYIPGSITPTGLYTFEQARQAGLDDPGRRTITSLVSGEKITLCGIVPEADNQSWYYLIDSPLVRGESGTCFIDELNQVYFAEGAAALTATPEMVKEFGLKVTNPGLVLGPFRPRIK